MDIITQNIETENSEIRKFGQAIKSHLETDTQEYDTELMAEIVMDTIRSALTNRFASVIVSSDVVKTLVDAVTEEIIWNCCLSSALESIFDN